MITRASASGFRSLDDLQLQLKVGLNVLAGPNGAGKSNILALLEFIGHVAAKPLHEAVADMGGAGRVFAWGPGDEMRSQLTARASGIALMLEEGKIIFVRYDYSFAIEGAKDGSEMKFGRQELGLSVYEDKVFKKFLQVDGDDADGYSVSCLVPEQLGTKAFPQGHVSEHELKQDVENAARAPEWVSKSLLERLGSLLYRVHMVEQDLSQTVFLRIDPNAARVAEDVGSPPGMLNDGWGLASTLRHMEQKAPEAYRKVVELLKVGNPEIVGLEVKERERELRVWFTVKAAGGKPVGLPITCMSDGTVKWLAFVTAVEWQGRFMTGLAIEELENFLHPWMQQEAMKLLRARCERSRMDVILVSTHSETILNCAKPGEVVICRMEEGVTKVGRASNAEELSKAINESGFGLGYFYIAGAVEDEV